MTAPAKARTGFRDVDLYDPRRAPAAIDLSDNTNRWGPPPSALAALSRESAVDLSQYPTPYSTGLKQAIASYAGVDPSMIVTGNGSDTLLDAAIRAFGEPGEVLSMPDPSFQMIPRFARMNGLSVAYSPFTDTGDIALQSLFGDGPAIVYLCTPNSPTGMTIPRATIEAVLERNRGLTIVDEAYVEFGGNSSLDLVPRYPGLLVTRTLSKAFGLAGLRVGYAVGQSETIREVEKSRGPYNVGALAEHVAIRALTDDREWMQDHVTLAIASRDRLSVELKARGIVTLPSAANFVLAPVSNAREVAAQLALRGIAVRAFEGLASPSPALRQTNGCALRITAGPWPEMVALLDALDSLAAPCT